MLSVREALTTDRSPKDSNKRYAMQKCEDCGRYKNSAIRRPDLGRVLCSGCYLRALLPITPIDLVQMAACLRAGAAR